MPHDPGPNSLYRTRIVTVRQRNWLYSYLFQGMSMVHPPLGGYIREHSDL